MRKEMNGLLLAVSAVAYLSVGAVELPAASPIRHEWHFDTNQNPAPADANGGTATIATGELSSGWLADLSVLSGSSGGGWDLGKSGNMVINLPQPLGGTVKVKVKQWWDGSIFDLAQVNVPGASAVSGMPDISLLGSVGGWVVDETTFVSSPGAKLDQVTVTAGAKGAVIDSVEIEALIVVPLPLELSIKLNPSGDLELSWPQGAGPAVVESNGDITDSAGWAPLESTAQVVNGRYTLTVPASGAGQCYRLRQ